MLQVVFHAEIQREAGRFDADDVCRSIVDKLIRRHPHVFGDETVATPAEVENRWERIKEAEKRERGELIRALRAEDMRRRLAGAEALITENKEE